MVDKILSPVGANELILKVNEVIEAIPVNVSQLENDAGYITGISSSDIETALGYVPYSASNPDGFISSAALSSLTDTSLSNLSNGQGLIYNSTTQKWENGTIATNISWGAITGTLTDQTDLATALNGKQGTISGAASSITTSNLTGSRVLVSGTDGKVAASAITTTKLGYLTDVTSNIQAQLNGKTTMAAVEAKGYITGITSSDVTTALGFTPYNSTNPAGYTSNIGTVTKVNNIEPDASGNVTVPAGIEYAMVITDYTA